MAKSADSPSAVQPAAVRISRLLSAPRATVFKAWSSSDHVRRWFAPGGFTVPHARVQMHADGPFELCMRSPDGVEHWVRGQFIEVVPTERLVLQMRIESAQGHVLFLAHTEAIFTDAPGGTRLDLVQTYTLLDPAAAAMTAGAETGWGQTLDNLATELARMQDPASIRRSAIHATFHIERTYHAPLERLFRALSDETAKSRWFSGDPGQWELLERHLDFRLGGRERVRGRWEGGVVSTFDAIYQDIIPQERIVYTYEMHLDDRKISVSLATLELQPDGERTTLRVTEQGVFLDGYDDAGSREQGTRALLERLAAAVET